jgi:hypothetical protein
MPVDRKTVERRRKYLIIKLPYSLVVEGLGSVRGSLGAAVAPEYWAADLSTPATRKGPDRV